MPSESLQRREPVEPLLLSPIEGMFWHLEEHFGGAFRVVVVLRLDGCIEADSLATALRHLQRRHPKLRAVIAQGSDGRLRYEFEDSAPPPIPFEIMDYKEEDLPWREGVRQLLQTDWQAGPLAAVTVLRSRPRGCSELLLTAHHAIADGMSAIMLMDDLLTEYAKAEANPDAPPPPVLPAVVAKRAKPSGGWLSRLWLLQRFVRNQREERRSRQTSLPETRGIPPQSQWVHWVLSTDDTTRLVRRCRKEQVSLAGALAAAAYSGLMDCLPVSQALFKCQFPFNLREVLEGSAGPVTAQDLGCFASIMNQFCEVHQPPTFWNLARHEHQSLQVFVKHGGPSFNYNMAAVAATRLFERASPILTASSNKRVTLLVANYGVINIRNEYGSLRPRECTLTFKNDLTGPSLLIEALVLGQRLNIGFAADSLEPAFWDRLQMAVRRRLEAASAAIETASIEA